MNIYRAKADAFDDVRREMETKGAPDGIHDMLEFEVAANFAKAVDQRTARYEQWADRGVFFPEGVDCPPVRTAVLGVLKRFDLGPEQAAQVIAAIEASVDQPGLEESLDTAWLAAEKALLAKSGGSPYLSLAQDLMAWCGADAVCADPATRGSGNPKGLGWEATGDSPALAMRALAKAITEEDGKR